MELKTPLYDVHVALGGKIVPFAGYLLPVQYPTGVITEHMAVREKAGLFDVSHMGEIVLSGPDALNNVQMLLTNNFDDMEDGQVRYSPMCNDKGGVVDDLIVYRIRSDCYMMVVNAANHDKDAAWISSHLTGDVQFEDYSDRIAQVALQGPQSEAILEKVCAKENIPPKYYTYTKDVEVAGCRSIVSRTGYTGEDGFEVYCAKEDAVKVWNALLEAGKENGLIPCGLGARDTLRLEAGMPLYGHEMNEETTPVEAGFGAMLKLDGQPRRFTGSDALRNAAPKRILTGLVLEGRRAAREGCTVLLDGKAVGHVTSGAFAPSLQRAVAMAYLSPEAAAFSSAAFEVDTGRVRIPARIETLPFYRNGTARKKIEKT